MQRSRPFRRIPIQHREQTVLAGMMACAALVTCGVATVYLLFPQTQAFESVLGPCRPGDHLSPWLFFRAPRTPWLPSRPRWDGGSARIMSWTLPEMTADGVPW